MKFLKNITLMDFLLPIFGVIMWIGCFVYFYIYQQSKVPMSTMILFSLPVFFLVFIVPVVFHWLNYESQEETEKFLRWAEVFSKDPENTNKSWEREYLREKEKND